MQKSYQPIAIPGMPQKTHIAEHMASERAANMVLVLESIAMDVTVHADVRRRCANDLLDRALGKVAVSVTAVVNHNFVPDDTVEGLIIEAEESAASLERCMEYAGKLPFEMWPDDVKRAMSPVPKQINSGDADG